MFPESHNENFPGEKSTNVLSNGSPAWQAEVSVTNKVKRSYSRNAKLLSMAGALADYAQTKVKALCGGIASLDAVTGGIPQGALTQVCTPKGLSSGKSAALVSLLAELTGHEHFCALVDARDDFDPEMAAAGSVDMRRLLWVRCSDKGMRSGVAEKPEPAKNKWSAVRDVLPSTEPSREETRSAQSDGAITYSSQVRKSEAHSAEARRAAGPRSGERVAKGCSTKEKEDVTAQFVKEAKTARRLKPLEQAFKAADILVQNGGFGLIVVDLSSVEEQQLRKVPLSTWFRFARVVEKTTTALVFLVTYPAAQSCAALTLHVTGAQVCWTEGAGAAHTQLVQQVRCETETGRARMRKAVQSARSSFNATAIWG